MVGVVGSSPIAPTKAFKELGHQRVAFFFSEAPPDETPGNRSVSTLVVSRHPGESLLNDLPNAEASEVTAMSIKGNPMSAETDSPAHLPAVCEEWLQRLEDWGLTN
jgi:hypothetical protein